MTTKIYFIRHGEVNNPNGILYGRLPGFGLSEKGIKEIEQTAKFLKTKPVDLIYASPLLRAKQSAEIIRKELNLSKIYISKYIFEVKTSFQGKLYTDVAPDQSDIYFSPKRLKTDETLPQIATRMTKFVDEVTKKHTGKHIVAVSHGDPLMVMRAVLSGFPAEYQFVRAGNGFTYIKHGEVIGIEIDEYGKKLIKSIFKPV